jgi:hypothetical protein
LFAPFTLYKGGKKLKVAFTESLRSSGTWSMIIRMVQGRYFEIVTIIHYSNWIQLAPDSIMRLIWCGCKLDIPCSIREWGYKRYGFGLLNVQYSAHGLVPVQVFRYHFEIREYNWWWNLAVESISYGICLIPINSLNRTYGSENVDFGSKIVTLDR